MKKFYAETMSSAAHNVALAFNSKAERDSYLESYNGEAITRKQAMKRDEIRHFYAKTGNDWFSQLYPKNMW